LSSPLFDDYLIVLVQGNAAEIDSARAHGRA
jgi:hypothetical protein